MTLDGWDITNMVMSVVGIIIGIGSFVLAILFYLWGNRLNNETQRLLAGIDAYVRDISGNQYDLIKQVILLLAESGRTEQNDKEGQEPGTGGRPVIDEATIEGLTANVVRQLRQREIAKRELVDKVLMTPLIGNPITSALNQVQHIAELQKKLKED